MPVILMPEDYDFWLRLASLGVHGKLLPEPLFFYRRHTKGRSAWVRRQVSHAQILELLREVSAAVEVPRMFNQIHGGKSPPVSLTRLRELGVSMVNYSTPALFAAQMAIEATLDRLLENDAINLSTNAKTFDNLLDFD